jgi:glycerophosphoryl diester phosphodiesterase
MELISMAFLSMSMCAGAHNHGHSVEVQGHRGSRGLYPENTLPGFAAAIEAGAAVLELDLHVACDGAVVVHHDYSLHEGGWDREEDASLLIRDKELAEIKKIDCGRHANPQFPRQQSMPGTQIPTLDELFEMIKGSSHPNAKLIRLNLEIKRDARYPEMSVDVDALASKIVAKVKEYGFSQRVYYSSFDPEVLRKIHELDSQAELGFLFSAANLAAAELEHPENPLGHLMKQAKSLHARVISPHRTLLTDAKIVQEMKQSGFRVVPWTVNAPEDWKELIEMGVDGIITDYPQDLLQFLDQKR